LRIISGLKFLKYINTAMEKSINEVLNMKNNFKKGILAKDFQNKEDQDPPERLRFEG